jgi:predicted acyltransferase
MLKLSAAGLVCLVLGAGLDYFGLCPSVKRIWTPAWTLYSGGWCFLLVTGFYWLIDVQNFRTWAFPLKVIGMNSIAAYLIAHLFDHFIEKSLHTHLGSKLFQILGSPLEPLLLGLAILLCYWLILLWMYQRKIFLRI